MPSKQTTTSSADKQPSIACPAVNEPKRRGHNMGERSTAKTKREFTGILIENLGTSSYRKADGVKDKTTTHRRTLSGNMKTILKTNERKCIGTSSQNIGTMFYSKKLADEVKATACHRPFGNLNASTETNDPNVVPIRFYGEGHDPEYRFHQIELVLKKLSLKPLSAQRVQVTSDAEIEAFIHDFPNKCIEGPQRPRNKQKRQTSLPIEQDTNKETCDIDYIANVRKTNDNIEYLVKWTGYSPKDSSWVLERDVEATEIVGFFRLKRDAHLVIKQKLRDGQKSFTPFLLDKYDRSCHKRWKLLETEFNWNTIIDGKAAPIFIEDWSDKGEGQSFNFEYITRNRYSNDVVEALRNIDSDSLKQGCGEGCECKNVKNCCARYHEGQNYNCGKNSKGIQTIKWSKSYIDIVECGEHCKCDPTTCHQRVLQKGRKVQLVLFWEGNKGWGLRTINKIPKNAFVGEYVGEVISFTEAESPGRSTTYQFELRTEIPALDNKILVIDAKNFGNETRFINHSCKPNLEHRFVYTNKYSSYDSRIGFYSIRDIEPGEEITFDYYPHLKSKKREKSSIDCRCGEEDCRGWLPSVLRG